MNRFGLAMLVLTLGIPAAADAQGIGGKAARETAELLVKKFGGKAASEGAEALAGKVGKLAARYGDDALAALRKVGPRAMNLVDDAGDAAPKAVKLLARHGDDAARVIGNPVGMKIFRQFGDDGAEAMIKHAGIAEPLVEKLGKPAVDALSAVGTQNGRRLAMMAGSGELAAIGHTPELMEVIARRGDTACDFIWRNKGVLAGGATLAAFLANPEPYIDGTNQLVGTVTADVIQPAAIAAATAAGEGAYFSWLAMIAAFIGLAGFSAYCHRTGYWRVIEKKLMRAAVKWGARRGMQ